MKNVFILTAMLAFFAAEAQINTTPATESSPSKIETKDKYKPKGVATEKFLKRENLMVGGILDLGFSNQFFIFGISPEISYFIYPDWISLGFRANYSFYRNQIEQYNSNNYSGAPFIRAYIWKGIFAQAEYELSSVNFPVYADTIPGANRPVFVGTSRGSLNSFLVGGGFHQNFESGMGFYFQMLYNVLQTTEYLYPNPSFRAGITYRFNAK